MKNKIKYTKKIGQELPPDDIVGFLREKRGGVVIRSFNWWPPLRSRVWAFVAMLKGYFSFGEFCQLLLPLFFREKLRLMDRYDVFLCEELKEECPSFPNNYVNLFGHKFGGPNYHEVIELINEVVILDQYHASQFIKKNSVIIDAGAHIGAFSVFIAHSAPQSHIYSFEPVAENFQALKNNAEYYPQITCVNSGLGDKISQKNIFVDSRNTSGSIFEDSPFYSSEKLKDREGIKLESVNILTIDAFVAECGISHVDFIKIDTEGYEAKILNGAKEAIKKWKPVIAMSAYHNHNDKEDLPRIIKEICSDYICELHGDHEEDFICYIRKE